MLNREAEFKAMVEASLRRGGAPLIKEKIINPLSDKPKTLTQRLIEENS